MNLKIISKVIAKFFLVIIVFTNCSSQTNIPDKISGMLLYIEDLNDNGGSMDGDFSDIVAFDVDKKQQHIITSDVYYDDYPTYSKSSNRIYFESKRENYNWAVGLSAQSYLYYIDLKEKRIRSFSKEEKNNLDERFLENDLTCPSANPVKNEVLFMTKSFKDDFYYQLIDYDYALHEYKQLMDVITISFRLAWDEEGTKIAFLKNDTARTNSISIFDVNTNELQKIVYRSSYRNELGDYKYDKLLYIEKMPVGNNNSRNLCVYDIGKKSGKILGNVKTMGFEEIKTPVFKDENTIFFIGCKDVGKDDFYEDIYEMNLTTKETTQITFTNNEKEHLRYYE